MTGAVVLMVVAAAGAAWLWRKVVLSGFVQFLWHFCTGLEMGDARRERRWSRGRHAAVRGGTVAVLAGLLTGQVVAPTVTGDALAAAAVVCAVAGGWWLQRRIRGWHHHRHYVQPLIWSVTEALAEPDRIQIERTGNAVTSATVAWAPDTEIGPKDQERVLHAASTRLALEGAVAQWNLRGRNRSATFTPCPSPPPTEVTLRDVKPAIKASGESVLIAGIGQLNTAVAINLHSDACHAALSIGPGGGKTLAARALAIQVLYKGGLVVVLNAKKTGYNWTRGLPNVAHAKTIDEIADAILWVDTERKRREDVVEYEGDIEDEVPAHVNVGARILVVFEEQNLTVPKLKHERTDAFDALGDLNFAGRAARIHLLAIAQRYSAKAAGGGDVRAAVNARLLGRYDKKAWNMLADSFPMPAPNNAPGRVQVVTDEVHEAQMPKVSGQEAHDYALSGDVARCPVDMPSRCAIGVPALAGALRNSGAEQGFPLGQPLSLPPYEPEVITLREACDQGYFGRRTLETVRSASKRDPAFPQPVSRDGTAGFTYDDDELREYAARKAGRR